MKRVNLFINNDTVQGDGVSLGAEGTHDFVTLRMTFGDTWTGTSKTVTFKDAKGINPVFVLITSSMKVRDNVYDVKVPIEPMRYAGDITVSIKGYETEEIEDEEEDETITVETYAIVTADAHFSVLSSSYDAEAEESVQPSPTIAAQLQSEIDGIESLVQTATNARKWVDGKNNDGTDIPSTDPAYNNNAKYYKEQASAQKDAAALSASASAGSASSAASSAATAAGLAQSAIRAYPLTEQSNLAFTITANTCSWVTSAGALAVTLGNPVASYENEWRLVIVAGASSSLSVTVPTGYTLKWNDNLQPPMTNGKLYEISFYLTPGNIIRGSFGEVDY